MTEGTKDAQPAPNEELHREYLGDGVYASVDGYHIWLAVNHHSNNVVALEPYVMHALVRYAKRVSSETGRMYL